MKYNTFSNIAPPLPSSPHLFPSKSFIIETFSLLDPSHAHLQGYRSRAAFKLIQINKKHDFLSTAKVCIDLCAAPGGWCQVAAKVMPANSIVLGIDLLPIRPIRNVKTIVSDITTAECRALVKREIPNGWNADVVLCDGAPNVGAAYVKDAFVQNELALAALKTATDHLGKGGTFCTKVYRSQDYNALIWVFKQLFDEVQAIKPSSSRAVSAEIFVLCTKYRAPASLDPRLLDPAHVFKQLDIEQGDRRPSIFDKAYGTAKRQRGGYDDALGQVPPSARTHGPPPFALPSWCASPHRWTLGQGGGASFHRGRSLGQTPLRHRFPSRWNVCTHHLHFFFFFFFFWGGARLLRAFGGGGASLSSSTQLSPGSSLPTSTRSSWTAPRTG
jgi:cell division protein FtsJ